MRFDVRRNFSIRKPLSASGFAGSSTTFAVMPKVKSTYKSRTELKQLSGEERALRSDLLDFFYTNPLWPGDGESDGEVFIKSTQFEATSAQRALIQTAGELYGCHTCLTEIVADRNQPWTGDHNPPTNLTTSVKEELFENWDGQTMLLAQCDECSSRQSGLVKKLNVQNDPTDYMDSLPEKDQDIILGGRTPKISSSGSKVTQPEGLAIQKEGIAKVCHSCGSRIPSHTYHADHLPPAEMLTSYMPEVCRKLQLKSFLSAEHGFSDQWIAILSALLTRRILFKLWQRGIHLVPRVRV